MARPLAQPDTDSINHGFPTADRSTFRTIDTVKHIWQGLGLSSNIIRLELEDADELGLPSSFKVGHLAQASIALSALAAAAVGSLK